MGERGEILRSPVVAGKVRHQQPESTESTDFFTHKEHLGDGGKS